MAFNGSLYAVSFDNLRRLMGLGTDVVVIEKEGPTMKLIPHTKNVWIALIESQGFLVEYAIALADSVMVTGPRRRPIHSTASIHGCLVTKETSASSQIGIIAVA